MLLMSYLVSLFFYSSLCLLMMARLSSLKQLVSLSSRCSMRSSRYQLSTIGNPKLPTALKISLVSMAVKPAR